MKTICFLTIFVWMWFNSDLAEIRKIYPKVADSESNAKEFSSKLTNITFESEKTLIAYKGASIALISKYSKGLNKRINTFKEGVKWIEFAIEKEPKNIEARLVRLSVQENVPGITGYRKNIKEDAAFIMSHYKEQSAALKEYLIDFIKQSKSINDAEKQSIK